MSISTPSFVENNFNSLMQAWAAPGQELRFDDIESGDLYHGRAVDSAATSAPVWEVVRFYRSADGVFERARYRTNVAWDNRTSGW